MPDTSVGVVLRDIEDADTARGGGRHSASPAMRQDKATPCSRRFERGSSRASCDDVARRFAGGRVEWGRPATRHVMQREMVEA